jgi:hypothetical protein
VAILALVVAVIAAGFTGWQAVTAHIARTRPTAARWTASYPAADSLGISQDWQLHNAGGSIAFNLTVSIHYPEHDGRPASDTEFTIDGDMRAGQARAVPGSALLGDPRIPLQSKGGASGTPVPKCTAGSWFLMNRQAHVSWRDYRGRYRDAAVRLRHQRIASGAQA